MMTLLKFTSESAGKRLLQSRTLGELRRIVHSVMLPVRLGTVLLNDKELARVLAGSSCCYLLLRRFYHATLCRHGICC